MRSLRTRRLTAPVAVAASAVLALVIVLASMAPTSAQITDVDDATTTTTMVESDGPSPAGNILPRPDTGQAPDSPNDPGGWQQYLVFGLILAGIGLIVGMVIRESRRVRSRQATGPSA